MSLSIWFNSTVMVFWALGLIPYAMKSRRYWILLLSGIVLIPLEIFLTWNTREYPYNIVTGVGIFFMDLTIGLIVYFIKKRKGEYD